MLTERLHNEREVINVEFESPSAVTIVNDETKSLLSSILDRGLCKIVLYDIDLDRSY